MMTPRGNRMRVVTAIVAYNEAEKLKNEFSRFQPEYTDKILFIDDGSTDASVNIARSFSADIITHATRQGVGVAIRDAILYAKKYHFDIVTIMAGNDKDRPEEIPKLVAKIADEGYDFVQGSRYEKGGNYGNMPFYRQIATRIVHPILFLMFTGRWISDTTNGFRAIRVSFFDDSRINIMQSWLDTYELEVYLLYYALALRYKVGVVPVTKIYPKHELGYTKMKPFRDWWKIIRPILFLKCGVKK